MTMSFEQLLLLSVASDVVFALVIAFAAFLFDRRLQERRARDETLEELAPKRVEAFASLWGLTEGAASRDRTQLDQELTDWYYKDAGALFLSWSAADCLLRALDVVRDPTSSDSRRRTVFSTLRTELKIDAGIYRSSERNKQTFVPRPSPSPTTTDPGSPSA